MADPLDILYGRRGNGESDEFSATLANLANMVMSIPERRAKANMQRMELAEQQYKVQEHEQKFADLRALDEAFRQPGGRAAVLKSLPGHLRPKVAEHFAELDEKNAKRTKAMEEARIASEDTIARALTIVRDFNYDPMAAQGVLSTLKGYYGDDPQRLQELQLVEAALQENPSPEHARTIVDALIARSGTQRKADTDAAKATADIASTEAQTELRQQELAGAKPIQPLDAAKLQADAEQAAATRALTEAQRAEQARHNRATEAAAFGNLSVAKAREAREAAKPVGADKPPTGQQRRALGFFNRAKQADDDLEGVENAVAKMGVAGQARMKFAPNVLQSDVGQRYNQSQRAFTEARLRKDSGAAIPEHEFESDRKTYFAEPGDSAAVLAQKRRARAALIASLGAEAGASALREHYGEEGDSLVQSYRERAAKDSASKPAEKKNPFR